MSSAIIKMKRGSETDLAEVSKSILDDFKVNDPNFERVPIGGTKDDSGNLDFGEDGDSDGDYSGDYV